MTKHLTLNTFAFAALLSALISSQGKAANSVRADLYDVPKVTLLENKKYTLKNELTGSLGYLASDPYVKYIVVGASYTRTFTQVTAWEVFNANYSYGFDAGLKKDLVEDFNAPLSAFDKINGYVTSNIVLSPIYTKNLLFNSSIVYSQYSFVAGGGVSEWSTAGIEPIFDLGLIFRYFLTQKTSLKIDFRDYIFTTGPVSNNIAIMVGYSFNFGKDGK